MQIGEIRRVAPARGRRTARLKLRSGPAEEISRATPPRGLAAHVQERARRSFSMPRRDGDGTVRGHCSRDGEASRGRDGSCRIRGLERTGEELGLAGEGLVYFGVWVLESFVNSRYVKFGWSIWLSRTIETSPNNHRVLLKQIVHSNLIDRFI